MKIELTVNEAMMLYNLVYNKLQSYYAIAKSCKQHELNYFASKFEKDAQVCMEILNKLGELNKEEPLSSEMF